VPTYFFLSFFSSFLSPSAVAAGAAAASPSAGAAAASPSVTAATTGTSST